MYFPPALIQNRESQSFGMIDGGVFANNPAMCALVSGMVGLGLSALARGKTGSNTHGNRLGGCWCMIPPSWLPE
jgi:patatin-like phospholipase/acyl hydrolase